MEQLVWTVSVAANGDFKLVYVVAKKVLSVLDSPAFLYFLFVLPALYL